MKDVTHASLHALPSLVLHRITCFCARETLLNLRLTCRALTYEATRTLFAVCYLGPTEESATKFSSIRNDPTLARWVRTVCLVTCEEEKERYSGETDQISDTTKRAFLSLADLPHLTGLEIVFSSICALDSEDRFVWGDVPQTAEFRYKIMKQLLKLYNAAASNQNIRSLSIYGLQNVNDPKIVESTDFKSLISGLTSLSLYIASENDDGAPENSIWFPEVAAFAHELPSTWLTSQNLTNLVLYFDAYVGYMPRIDLRKVHLPHLRLLALGNFVFSHDWQLEWILSHRDTLEEIYLDDCPIIYAWRIIGEEVDDEGYIKDDKQNWVEGPDEIRFYDKRWYHYLDKFHEELSALRYILICSGEWDNGKRLFGRVLVNTKLLATSKPFDGFYMVFDSGIGPDQYTVDEDGGITDDWELQNGIDKALFQAPQCDDQDREAYNRLLLKLGLLVGESEKAGT